MSESNDTPENPEKESANSSPRKRKTKTTKTPVEEYPITHEDGSEVLSAVSDSDETTPKDDLSDEEEGDDGDDGDDGDGGDSEAGHDTTYFVDNLDDTIEPEAAIESADLDDDWEENTRDVFDVDTDEELLNRIAGVYQIWWNWAHFELSIISPYIEPFEPAVMIEPESLNNGDDTEFVYPIVDYGNRLATSKAEDMYSAGMSMCKLYYTIEKMIHILIERLKSSGIDTETEVQIAFDGHQFAQRKAFESVINLNYNVVVTNFDPGAWGERYLEIVKRLAEKGYGYPAEAPRETYRQFSRTSIGVKR